MTRLTSWALVSQAMTDPLGFSQNRPASPKTCFNGIEFEISSEAPLSYSFQLCYSYSK